MIFSAEEAISYQCKFEIAIQNLQWVCTQYQHELICSGRYSKTRAKISKQKKYKIMKERIVRAVAGTMVLISISLAVWVNIHWLWLAAFVGLNLFQSSITKFCPLELILDKAGVKSGSC